MDTCGPQSANWIYNQVNTMIIRDLSATNMGRGAYDTTGVPKPQPPPKR